MPRAKPHDPYAPRRRVSFEDHDPLFDAAVKRQYGPIVAALTGADPNCVNRLPVEMAGDAIAIHVHPTRNDMPLLVPNQSPWCWV